MDSERVPLLSRPVVAVTNRRCGLSDLPAETLVLILDFAEKKTVKELIAVGCLSYKFYVASSSDLLWARVCRPPEELHPKVPEYVSSSPTQLMRLHKAKGARKLWYLDLMKAHKLQREERQAERATKTKFGKGAVVVELACTWSASSFIGLYFAQLDFPDFASVHVVFLPLWIFVAGMYVLRLLNSDPPFGILARFMDPGDMLRWRRLKLIFQFLFLTLFAAMYCWRLLIIPLTAAMCLLVVILLLLAGSMLIFPEDLGEPEHTRVSTKLIASIILCWATFFLLFGLIEDRYLRFSWILPFVFLWLGFLVCFSAFFCFRGRHLLFRTLVSIALPTLSTILYFMRLFAGRHYQYLKIFSPVLVHVFLLACLNTWLTVSEYQHFRACLSYARGRIRQKHHIGLN
eukprot:TRINITY_DN9669_c0_g1_i1.p1 TRINITY_DN9669_c0_g1~~TRINITY_DN9669_c0_g1_i1.p1  ORF type:complete len:402 (-),score=3.72 TRINITY_DN9669_c0_g1_i1:59-1264(-)